MSNYESFCGLLKRYFQKYGVEAAFRSSLHECSVNNASSEMEYLYQGLDLDVIDMDCIARGAYKKIKGADESENPINSADSFIINHENEWYFIEFKDAKLKNGDTKSNILKKSYSNWYMVLDILYDMREQEPYAQFDFLNPIAFGKAKVYYILVCSGDKNPQEYRQIRNADLRGEHYTPPFMQRLKDYLFKDAYAYTEDYFEAKFVKGFQYES